jgi:hypothetical protein
MSISTPQAGGNRRPSSKAVAGGKPAAKKAGGATKPGTSGKPDPVAKSGTSTGTKAAAPGARAGGRPPTGGRPGGTGRPPIAPIKVSKGRSWGSIALVTVVSLVAVGIIGFGVYEVHQNSLGWQKKADSISGVVDFRKTEADLLKPAQHAYGKLTYPQSPPVGGTHNPNWQRCQGDVYADQIPNENAVHALEHGSVWVTYNPSLPKDQVDKLASKVRGNDYMLMSPYPGLDKPISLQAWGFQLKLDTADDARIDKFIQDLRVNASMEPGAVCSSGNYTTKTGPDPVNLGQSAAPSQAGATG